MPVKMLRTRHQGDDMFRWARTEMKRELVMSQSSYAKIAGLQSEVGRVVMTRVAGSELEYKRTLNTYRKDMTCAVNDIRREQIKMRRKMSRYAKKLKQTKIENEKRIKEEIRRDIERAKLEELHLRLKFEAASRTPEPVYIESIVSPTDHDSDNGFSSDVEFDRPVYLRTGATHDNDGHTWEDSNNGQEKENMKNKPGHNHRNDIRSFSPILPMINEDAEKEIEEVIIGSPNNILETSNERDNVFDVNKLDSKLLDEEMSVSSYGSKRKKKKDVSFSDIIKLKYTGTKHLFDLVHILAKKHGILDVVEKVPDPRDHIVHRGATNDSDSLRMHAAVLYPMKYGYEMETLGVDAEAEHRLPNIISPVMLQRSIVETEIPVLDVDLMDGKPKRWRKLSLEQRRAVFLSGVHSKSLDGTGDIEHTDTALVIDKDDPRSSSPQKLKPRDSSLPVLVEKVAKIKLNQIERTDRLLHERRNSEVFTPSSLSPSNPRIKLNQIDRTDRLLPERRNSEVFTPSLLSPSHPSSSRSSRSLPPLSRHSGSSEDKVSWTQAFGILRAIHSLDDI